MKRSGYGTRHTLAAVTCSLLAACGGEGRQGVVKDDIAGPCSIQEPGSSPIAGVSGYVEHVTPNANGGFGVGSLGISLTCIIDGTAPEQVTLILPNLIRGRGIPTGEYRVRDPYQSAPAGEMVDPRTAWVRAQRGSTIPVLYTGVGGRVVITSAEEGVLAGAYQVALAPADSGVSLPGARPEVPDELAARTSGRGAVGRTVLAGAFAAPKTEAEWRGK